MNTLLVGRFGKFFKCVSVAFFVSLSKSLRALKSVLCFRCCCTGKFDIKVSAPKLGIELLVSEHATTTLKGKKVGISS